MTTDKDNLIFEDKTIIFLFVYKSISNSFK